VVLGVDLPYSKEGNSAAEIAAKAILESRGNSPRLYRNTLVFLAATRPVCRISTKRRGRFLAWGRSWPRRTI
jgi:hypothetical protein